MMVHLMITHPWRRNVFLVGLFLLIFDQSIECASSSMNSRISNKTSSSLLSKSEIFFGPRRTYLLLLLPPRCFWRLNGTTTTSTTTSSSTNVSSSVPYYYYGNNANSYAESGFSAPIGSMRKPGGGRFPSSSQMRRKPSFQGARRRRPFWGKGKRRRPFRGRNRFWNRNQNRKRRRRRNKNRGHRSTEGRTLMGSIIRAIQTIFTRSIAMLSRMFNSKDELDKKT